MGHEVRNPLGAMKDAVYYSRGKVAKSELAQTEPRVMEFLDIVDSEISSSTKIISDLLTFSRLSRLPLRKQPVLPAHLVRQALEALRAEQQGRRVQITIGDLPSCEADPTLLKQVFMNLLSNALKFTRDRDPAVIEIGVCTIEDCKSQIADWMKQEAGLAGDQIQSAISNLQSTVYFVRDNGVGFDMRYAHKLFGVFQRLHRAEEYEGTGVGLALVQRIIQRHGGRIWAEAAMDKGATFYFTI